MTDLIRRASVAGVLAALPLAFAAGDLKAQEEEAPVAQEACTAFLIPATIPAGSSPVAVKAELSRDVGGITGIEAPESGLALAEPNPEAEQAMEGEAPAEGDAEELVRPTNVHTVWFDATDAQPGDYQITLKAEGGECSADVTVVGGELPAEEESGSGE